MLLYADMAGCAQGKASVKGMRWFASKLRNFCTTPPTGKKTAGGSNTSPGPPVSPWTGALLIPDKPYSTMIFSRYGCGKAPTPFNSILP
jgi:hypothetical protein